MRDVHVSVTTEQVKAFFKVVREILKQLQSTVITVGSLFVFIKATLDNWTNLDSWFNS